MIKFLSIVILCSIMLGNWSFVDTRDKLYDKLELVSDSMSKVNGILGLEGAFRVEASESEYLDTPVYFEGETVSLKTALQFRNNNYDINYGVMADEHSKLLLWISDFTGWEPNNRVFVSYKYNFDYDYAQKRLYELTCNVYTDNGVWKVFIPCVRVSLGTTDYIILDPLARYPVQNGDFTIGNFNVKISYGLNNITKKPKYCWVPTNIMQVTSTELVPVSVDTYYNKRYESGLNFQNIIDWFTNNESNYIDTGAIDGYITATSLLLEDYVNGDYIYKRSIKVSD